MAKEKILVVEDEEDILELMVFNLKKEGYSVHGCLTGEEGYRMAGHLIPDLILLDVMLPGMDGLTVLRKLKGEEKTKNIPVIMATARSEDSDVIVGLELGADDYITKPFSLKVLLARVRAVFRRASAGTEEKDNARVLNAGPLIIDSVRRKVEGIEDDSSLTATEFDILFFLAKKPGWVFSRNQIINGVKGGDYPVTDRSVDVQIVSLRKKLGVHGGLIKTVRGVGYSFQETDE